MNSLGALVLFEDAHVSLFDPVVLTRSAASLRLGAWTHAERAERAFPERELAILCRPAVAEVEAQAGLRTEWDSGDVLFVAAVLGRALTTVAAAARALEPGEALVADGRLVAARAVGDAADRLAATLREALGDSLLPASSPEADTAAIQAAGTVRDVDVVWPVTLADLIGDAGDAITADWAAYEDLIPSPDAAAFPGVHLLDPHRIRLADGVSIDPGVVLDAREGPILIGPGARIGANSYIGGPLCFGPNCLVKPLSRVMNGVSFGPGVRVGGEVHDAIVQSFSNKQHDGFLGNSYLGSWVNLGAATDTSDLKNDYGSVKLELAGRVIDTKRRSVGSLIGDHTKTAIHTRLNTGTVLGVSCNVFGAGVPPRAVPSFSWGGAAGWQEYRLEKAQAVAAIVTDRRGVEFTGADRRLFARVHSLAHG